MKRSKYNLVLVVWHDDPRVWSDLRRIAARVQQIDPDVRSFVVAHHKLDQLKLLPLWFQRTLSLLIPLVPKRKLLPGRFLTGTRLHKVGEYARLDAAGIPVPKWTIVAPDTQLDPTVWGPYVVEKPSAGRVGANIRVRRASRVRYTPPESFPAGHYGRQGPMLAQRFIYTGHWPTSYRVITLFGDTLLCYRQKTISRGRPLTGRWNFRETGGINVISNTKDMIVELVKDEDVIALAERAHRAAFQDFPVLAFDIIRDAETGELFVLECHAHGTWLFSSEAVRGIQAANNIDFESQFDLIEKSARILARETRSRAAISWPLRYRSQAPARVDFKVGD